MAQKDFDFDAALNDIFEEQLEMPDAVRVNDLDEVSMGRRIDPVLEANHKAKDEQKKSVLGSPCANGQSSRIIATDDTVFDIVRNEIKRLGVDADLNHIDVSTVSSFFRKEKDSSLGEGLFEDTNFQGDISKWDVSNVKNMSRLFSFCEKFNCDLSGWDVGKVKNMSEMFRRCKSFNQDIGNWNVSNVKNMYGMFGGCESFNKNLSRWNVSKVMDMSYMFSDCYKFNQPIGDWDVSHVENMRKMFSYCKVFNKDIGRWDVSRVMDMGGMFEACYKFNQDISNWNVSSVDDMSAMFWCCRAFNCDLSGWDVSNVTCWRNLIVEDMFQSCPIKDRYKPKFDPTKEMDMKLL
jgi:surface protein